MADQNLLVKMILDANNYDKGMAQAQKSVQGFINQNMSLGSVLGTAGKALGAFGAAVGVAGGAIEGAKRTIAATQTLTDQFGRSIEGAKSAVNSFFYSLATGNFDGFLSGLKQTIDYAKEAYNALDDLGTFNIFAGAQGAEIKQQREDLKAQIKTGYRYDVDEAGNVNRVKLSDKEIDAAKEKLRTVQAEYIQLIRQTADKEKTAYDALARKILSENKFTGTAEEMDEAVDEFMRSYGSYSVAQAKFDELQAMIDADTRKYKTSGYSSMYGTFGSQTQTEYGEIARRVMASAEYKNLLAILQISDDNLKELMQHRVSGAMAQAQLSAELRADEKVLSGGKSGGAEGVSGAMNDRFKAGPFGDTNRFANMTADEMAAAAEAIDDVWIEELETMDETTETIMARMKHEYGIFVEDLIKQSDKAAGIIDGLGASFYALGDVIGGTAGDNIKAIGQFIDAAQGMVPVIEGVIAAEKQQEMQSLQSGAAAMVNGTAQAGEAVAGIPVIGPALALSAIASMLGMVGAIKSIKFAEGGVVPGNNYTDGIQAKISAGEVVLNSHDAKNLYDQIHSGNFGGGGGAGYVSGENIYIGLNNYLGRTGKGKLVVR